MPKQETTKDSPGSLGSWQNRILETVDQYKDPLARILCPKKPVEALRFHAELETAIEKQQVIEIYRQLLLKSRAQGSYLLPSVP